MSIHRTVSVAGTIPDWLEDLIGKLAVVDCNGWAGTHIGFAWQVLDAIPAAQCKPEIELDVIALLIDEVIYLREMLSRSVNTGS